MENTEPRRFGRLAANEVDLENIDFSNFDDTYDTVLKAYKVNKDMHPILKVIRNIIHHHRDNLGMKNNRKYFNLYIILMESYNQKLSLYKELQTCMLFDKLPEFYKQYCLELQKNASNDMAKEILVIGIKETGSDELKTMLSNIEDSPAASILRPTKRTKMNGDSVRPLNTKIFNQMSENIEKGVPIQGQVIQQPKRVIEHYSIPNKLHLDHMAILEKEVNNPKFFRQYPFEKLHPDSYDYYKRANTMKCFEELKYLEFMDQIPRNVTTRRISKTPANRGNNVNQKTPKLATPAAGGASFQSISYQPSPITAKFDNEPTMTFHTKQALNDVNAMFNEGKVDSLPVELKMNEEDDFTQQLHANPSSVFKSTKIIESKVESSSDNDLDDSLMKQIESLEKRL
eukprot:NODE_10_length_61504_cov_0.956502.p18 type:complete len:400 gc:universal NODE_10_length_61504_cov_0.956502:17912-19111(+)